MSKPALRRTAFAVLWVWLFALGSAWANGCLLQQRNTHSHGWQAAPSTVAQALHMSTAHLGAGSPHSDDGAAKGACLKVCGDASQSIVKQAADLPVPLVGMSPPRTLPWPMPAAMAALGVTWLAAPARSPGVPLRTRYSRLAL